MQNPLYADCKFGTDESFLHSEQLLRSTAASCKVGFPLRSWRCSAQLWAMGGQRGQTLTLHTKFDAGEAALWPVINATKYGFIIVPGMGF